MGQYYYCLVRPKNMDTVYWYLADEDVKINSFVEIPFGRENRLRYGVVEEANRFSEADLPFPLERTKKITRVITEEEYGEDDEEEEESGAPDQNYGADMYGMDDFDEDDDGDEIEQARMLIEMENYDAAFQWACEHQSCIDDPEIMEMVCECYRICAEQGNPAAALNLGTMYYTGLFVRQDFRLAAELYQIAAAAGDRRAICNLGYCYYYGRHQAPDYERAYHYYNLGAILFDDPNCLYKLGDMYRDGKYVEKNEMFAVRLYFRALEEVNRPNEDPFCRADIQYRIGCAFLDGTVLKQDAKMALDYLMIALSGFYERRKTDPFVSSLIEATKVRIRQAQNVLDRETL